MIREIITKSSIQTQELGEFLVKGLKGGGIVCLEGDLGGGKTTFVQGLARGLGISQRITSPTFVLMKRFAISDKRFTSLYHIDCYRMKNPRELLELGFKEILEDKNALVVIEWADRIRGILPKERITIKFEVIDEKKRKITFENSKFLINLISNKMPKVKFKKYF